MKKVKTVAFHNLGCKVNAYEMEVMQQKFIESGLQIVPFDSIADVYVINTCSVTNIADRKSRQMLHRAKKTNPDAVVIAAGCYSQTDTEGARADDSVDIIIGNNHKTEIV
ncbi:MAG: tRNA (N(6)-L-threonylcarbamoyladenosine(37)-C(2))-methylthiotransferase MtaB, partial [Lachnospiraceae bacterium]|nr:tRNA (N(6)-L-threonylcarbamoyladenosine(37)-C(2))-methylthiotransferase MtaB [Lachnospiraceae bacterium]